MTLTYFRHVFFHYLLLEEIPVKYSLSIIFLIFVGHNFLYYSLCDALVINLLK